MVNDCFPVIRDYQETEAEGPEAEDIGEPGYPPEMRGIPCPDAVQRDGQCQGRMSSALPESRLAAFTHVWPSLMESAVAGFAFLTRPLNSGFKTFSSALARPRTHFLLELQRSCPPCVRL